MHRLRRPLPEQKGHVHMNTAVTEQSSSTGRAAQGAGEYLSFRLGAEEYGIDILKLQEIRGYELVPMFQA